MDLRDLARDQDCTIRLEGCPNNTDTTCLAHYRLAGTCGVGMKPSDLAGAHADEHCHSRVDSRVKCDLTHEQLRLAHAEGVIRTLDRLHVMGYRMRKG